MKVRIINTQGMQFIEAVDNVTLFKHCGAQNKIVSMTFFAETVEPLLHAHNVALIEYEGLTKEDVQGKEEESEEEEEDKYLNHYRCPSCGEEWQDTYSCHVNESCPVCDLKEIQPYRTEVIK